MVSWKISWRIQKIRHFLELPLPVVWVAWSNFFVEAALYKLKFKPVDTKVSRNKYFLSIFWCENSVLKATVWHPVDFGAKLKFRNDITLISLVSPRYSSIVWRKSFQFFCGKIPQTLPFYLSNCHFQKEKWIWSCLLKIDLSKWSKK